MHRKYAITAITLVSLLMAVQSMPSASAVDVDLTKYSAPGVDLWISDYEQVQYSEVCFLINYGNFSILLQIVNDTGKVKTTYTLDALSSDVFEIIYPDFGVYSVVVGGLNAPLIELPRERAANYLPPPRDSTTWTWTQPEKEPAKYGQSYVDELIVSLTLTNVLIAALLLSIGAALGAMIKSVTRFLVPTDFLTVILMALICLEAIFRPLSTWDVIWYLPLVVGYFLGFLLWHIDYILPVMTNCQEKTLDVRPVAIYLPDDGSGYCIQTQRNKELFKRFLGIPHRLGTDAGLPQDWTGYFKRPYLPKIRGRLTWVQKSEVTVEPTKIWRFNAKRYTTTYRLAHASGVEKAQWLNEAKWYFKLQDMFDRLSLKYNDLLMGGRSESTRISAAMVEHATSVNPSKRVAKWFGLDQGNIDLETGEAVFTEVEAESSKEQNGIAQRTAEEEGEVEYDDDGELGEKQETKPKVKVKKKKEQNDDWEE